MSEVREVLDAVRETVDLVTEEIGRSGWPQESGENAIARAHEQVKTLVTRGVVRGRTRSHFQRLDWTFVQISKILEKGRSRYDLESYLEKLSYTLKLLEARIVSPTSSAVAPTLA